MVEPWRGTAERSEALRYGAPVKLGGTDAARRVARRCDTRRGDAKLGGTEAMRCVTTRRVAGRHGAIWKIGVAPKDDPNQFYFLTSVVNLPYRDAQAPTPVNPAVSSTAWNSAGEMTSSSNSTVNSADQSAKIGR